MNLKLTQKTMINEKNEEIWKERFNLFKNVYPFFM